MLAACGFAQVDVVRRPKVAILSTGDELVALGDPLRPGAVYDSNGAIIAAAVRETGGEPVALGAYPDDEARSKPPCATRSGNATSWCSPAAPRRARAISRIASAQLGEPGVIVHGVALKPGKPLCLAVAEGKPIVVLPGFPTSAIFTFHEFVAPVIRAKAGLPPEAAVKVDATVPVRIPRSWAARSSCWSRWSPARTVRSRFRSAKGSGSVTTFSQADGFLEVDALRTAVDPGTRAQVTLIGRRARRTW